MSFIPRLFKALFSRKVDKRYPHEIFPEILLWERWDVLDYQTYGYYQFLEVLENGDCVIKKCSELEVWSIHKLKKWSNCSLRDRNIEKKMSRNDYTQFIRDFRQSYNEIKTS